MALYKASPTDVSNTIMNLCKSIALSERSHGINESLVMVDDCVVTVFSLLEEYAFGRWDLREEDRYSVCSNILCDIYRCADIEFCLGLNGHIVRHFSATTYLNVSHAQYLIDRYKRLSYNEHLRYGWVVLYSLYYTWNVSDRNDFLTYLGNLIQMEEGDYLLKLIVKFCGSDGRDYHNCEELILLINDECVVSSMIEKAVSQDKDKIYEETFNVIALNYKATLQNSRKK